MEIQTPEKPIPNRVARSLLFSLKDLREAAMKLRIPDPTRCEISDPLDSSDKVKTPSVSESPAYERKKRVNSVKQLEKYEMLEKFFSSMDSSIRLLHLKGSATTFTNVIAKVESLTDRTFTYSHLAQLKFILPEAIEIKKIIKYDERSCCMKPDLYITLNANAVDNNEKWKSNSSSLPLRKVFRSRLLDFFKSHPELVAVSHLSGSFRRSFSNRTSITGGKDGKEEDRVGLVPVSPVSIPLKVEGSTKKITVSCTDAPKLSSKQTSSMKYSSGGIVSASSPSCHLPAPPVIKAKKGNDGSMSAPETPMLEPPNNRYFMSPDDDPAELPMKLARHLSTRRSLFFDSPLKSAKAADQVCESGRFSTDDDILDILPENLLQSKLTSIIPRIREKESEAQAEQSSAISQDKRRKQMIARLPRLFDMIYFLFRSIKRSFMTKEELMHKVISSHLEITDKSEVEQKLILLQELAPEWIYEKPSSRGTILLL
ncbi:hypothetical protein BC332_01444 [Capsicum chinense]|nr:hypothetical protein BC332_01444 [Capsicum chinense]